MTDFEMDKIYTITGRELLALLSLIPDGTEKAKVILDNVVGREKSEVNESQNDFLKPCPLCGGLNLTKYRFDIGGFLYKDGCTETVCENGDMFRIECDCGCKFDKCQDELFDKAEGIYTCDGKYDVEITDADLWNILIADWNRRVSE